MVVILGLATWAAVTMIVVAVARAASAGDVTGDGVLTDAELRFKAPVEREEFVGGFPLWGTTLRDVDLDELGRLALVYG